VTRLNGCAARAQVTVRPSLAQHVRLFFLESADAPPHLLQDYRPSQGPRANGPDDKASDYMNDENRLGADEVRISAHMAGQIHARRQLKPERRQEAHWGGNERPELDRRVICDYCLQPGDHPSVVHCMQALERAGTHTRPSRLRRTGVADETA
jgi:hypothetical protein